MKSGTHSSYTLIQRYFIKKQQQQQSTILKWCIFEYDLIFILKNAVKHNSVLPGDGTKISFESSMNDEFGSCFSDGLHQSTLQQKLNIRKHFDRLSLHSPVCEGDKVNS